MCAIEPRHDRGEGYKRGGNIPYVGIYKNQLASALREDIWKTTHHIRDVTPFLRTLFENS